MRRIWVKKAKVLGDRRKGRGTPFRVAGEPYDQCGSRGLEVGVNTAVNSISFVTISCCCPRHYPILFQAFTHSHGIFSLWPNTPTLNCR